MMISGNQVNRILLVFTLSLNMAVLGACGSKDNNAAQSASPSPSVAASIAPQASASASSNPSPSAAATLAPTATTAPSAAAATASPKPSATAAASPAAEHAHSAAPSVSPEAPKPTASTAPAGGSETNGKVHTVEIKDFKFATDKLEIKPGDTVKFINRDDVQHNAVADDGSFKTEMLDKDKAAEVIFDEEGEFAYHCGPHPGMKATIVVKA